MGSRSLMLASDMVDIAVVGGGPAGLAAALWAARYRRRVMLVDGGQQRNRWTEVTHGYLGWEDSSPAALLTRARADVGRYPEIEVVYGVDVEDVKPAAEEGFELGLTNERIVHALRV